ncbi:MAG: MBL fold metallo-hydrolase [Betaproteobacteria bacterium]
MLRFKNLGSGSSGNATVVESRSGSSVTRLLVDCGLGLGHLDARLAQAGLVASQLDAVFITHEHGDHVGCVQKLVQRERMAVWMSHGTHLAMGAPDLQGLLRLARDGVPIALGSMELRPFTVPHDAREPLQLSCGDGASRLGILTDLGHATAHVTQHLSGCDALLLECNHDPHMLAASRYPTFLKRRVGGLLGHLSNAASATLAAALRHPRLQRVVAAHLSEQNNLPDLARAALAQALGCAGSDIGVAHAVQGTPWIQL